MGGLSNGPVLVEVAPERRRRISTRERAHRKHETRVPHYEIVSRYLKK
jgi:hypothetical protein